MTGRPAILAAVAVWHYSRLSVGLAAAVMTAASSIVLCGVLREDAVLLVGLGALAAYWFDDLVDLARDEGREPALRGTRGLRVVFLLTGMLAVAAYAIRVLPQESGRLQTLVAAVGVLTAAYCLRHAFVGTRRLAAMRHWIQALGWSAGCVLSPQLAANSGTTPQTWMAFGFFFLLMLPVIDLWQHASPQPRPRVRILAALCAVSALMALTGVAFRWFPWFNLSLLAAPATTVFFLWIRQQSLIRNTAFFTELAVGFNILCGLWVLGAYRSGLRPEDVGPHSVADYFQLAGIAALVGLIAGNLWWRRSEGVALVRTEGASSAVVTVGIALLAFHTFQSAFHLQSWLLPWLNTRFFDSAALQLAGAAMLGGAVLLLAVGYRQMGTSWRIGIDERTPGALVTSGLFNRSRNPIYLAVDLYMAGAFLMNSTPVALLYAGVTPLFLHRQIRREERFMQGLYGAQYTRYTARTPRYL